MKLDRLLAITMLLLNRRRVSAGELAARFEVSLRTVYRDIDAITVAGIPVVSFPGADGGYEIMESYRLERQLLTYEEMQSIIVALRGVRASIDEGQVGALLDKVGALIAGTGRANAGVGEGVGMAGRQELVIDINPWQGGERERGLLASLKAAIRENRLVRFDYVSNSGAASTRDVEPASIVLKGYSWYLYGFCRLRGEGRIFRLSRIEALAVSDERFPPRAAREIERLTYAGWSRPPDGECVRLVLRFHPRAKPRVLDYFERERIATEPDGTLVVTAVQPEEPWLIGYLLGYGADVRVVEPASVAEAVRRAALEVVRLYDDAESTAAASAASALAPGGSAEVDASGAASAASGTANGPTAEAAAAAAEGASTAPNTAAGGNAAGDGTSGAEGAEGGTANGPTAETAAAAAEGASTAPNTAAGGNATGDGTSGAETRAAGGGG
ncbi:YafY family transcriptional regulator [Paenibacillus sp. TRM 82003]|nr:YafY family transcriptional regulator [Paenibacillus sp. TRM 82003]